MKTLLSIALLLVATVSGAQQRSEFSLDLSESIITVKPGTSRQVTVSIARSKGFVRGDVKMGLSNILPEGVTINYEPAVGNFSSSTATITTSSSVAEGTYQIILNGTIQNKTKGAILKVVVGN